MIRGILIQIRKEFQTFMLRTSAIRSLNTGVCHLPLLHAFLLEYQL